MSKRSCSHWDLDATGTCPTCEVLIAVEAGNSISVYLGSTVRELAGVSGERSLPGQAPTMREALAGALGVLPSQINIVDAVPAGQGWERQTGVIFTLAGSKVEMAGVVSVSEATIRTPNRVEYEEKVEA